MDAIAVKINAKDVRLALENLPTTLEQTYDEVMLRISENGEDNEALAKQVLGLIKVAKRPLKLIEV